MMKKMKGGGLMKMMKRMGGMKGFSAAAALSCAEPVVDRYVDAARHG